MTHPPTGLDARVRVAAFEALRRMTALSGGVVTRDQMTARFQFEGERVPFANKPRGICKPGFLGTECAIDPYH